MISGATNASVVMALYRAGVKPESDCSIGQTGQYSHIAELNNTFDCDSSVLRTLRRMSSTRSRTSSCGSMRAF